MHLSSKTHSKFMVDYIPSPSPLPTLLYVVRLPSYFWPQYSQYSEDPRLVNSGLINALNLLVHHFPSLRNQTEMVNKKNNFFIYHKNFLFLIELFNNSYIVLGVVVKNAYVNLFNFFSFKFNYSYIRFACGNLRL